MHSGGQKAQVAQGKLSILHHESSEQAAQRDREISIFKMDFWKKDFPNSTGQAL